MRLTEGELLREEESWGEKERGARTKKQGEGDPANGGILLDKTELKVSNREVLGGKAKLRYSVCLYASCPGKHMKNALLNMGIANAFQIL